MRPVVTADEYTRVDKAFDGDLEAAMDRAGYAVALAAARNGAGYGARVIVLAGPGNNGGDGYVAARYLQERGCSVEVQELKDPATQPAMDAAAKARDAGIRIRPMADTIPCDLIVDAVFGGGVRSDLPDVVRAWMDVDVPVVAVDYPTGLDPNTGKVPDRAFDAVETVTFQSLKTGHMRGRGPDLCGRVTVVDIGIPGGEPAMFLAEEADARLPGRDRLDHKWSAGSVLVVGGSPGLRGASIFAGRAALEFGAGSVYVAVPTDGDLAQVAPELPTIALEDAASSLRRFDVVLAGPGLASEHLDRLMPVLHQAERLVLDAGALRTEALEAAVENDAEVVITPHSGEFERIIGNEGGVFAARAAALKFGITVLLKGNPTVVTDGDKPVLVRSGGPELASIGTGDVLAGMVAALWARGLPPLGAALSAAYWHGTAGADIAENSTVTAPRLLDRIGRYAW